MKHAVEQAILNTKGQSDLAFILEVIQRGRPIPARYKHRIKMPIWLYKELRANNVLDFENYFLYQIAFFEVAENHVILNFMHLFECEDCHRHIDYYLVKRVLGTYPIERSYSSKMNFDKTKEPMQHIKNEKYDKGKGTD